MKAPTGNPWRELAALGVLGMETAWVTAWVRRLMPPSAQVGAGRLLAALGGLALLTYLWLRLSGQARLRPPLQRGGLLALLLGGVLSGWRYLIAHTPAQAGLSALVSRPLQSFTDLSAVIPPEAVVLFAVLTLWWLSIRLAGVRVGPQIVWQRFRFGVFGFALWAALTLGRPDIVGVGLLALFVGAWLLAMTAARVAVLSLLRGGRRSPFNRRWLSALFGAVGGVALAATGAAIALAGPLTQVAGLLMTRLVQGVIVLLSSPFVALLIALAPWLERLQEVLLTTAPAAPTVTPTVDAAEQLRRQMEQMAAQSTATAPDWGLLKGLLVLTGVLLVILLALRSGGAVVAGRTEAPEEGLEPLPRGGRWRWLRRAFGPSRTGRWLSAAARRRAAARIRRIYADLLAWGARLGQPRPPEATPLEYLPLLTALLPEEADALRHITQAYLRVRYGELPETAAEVQAVERAWSAVRRRAAKKEPSGLEHDA